MDDKGQGVQGTVSRRLIKLRGDGSRTGETGEDQPCEETPEDGGKRADARMHFSGAISSYMFEKHDFAGMHAWSKFSVDCGIAR